MIFNSAQLAFMEQNPPSSNKTPIVEDDPLTGELGIISNSDGSNSTERSITTQGPNGKWYNLPSLVKGQVDSEGIASGNPLSIEQESIAVERFTNRGGFETSGFDTVEEAETAAQERSDAGGSTSKFNDLTSSDSKPKQMIFNAKQLEFMSKNSNNSNELTSKTNKFNSKQLAFIKNNSPDSYASSDNIREGFLDNLSAPGAAIRSTIISSLEGQGLEATKENMIAAWNTTDETSSFMDAMANNFDKIRIAPEGTYNPLITEFAKSPRLSAAATVVFGGIGDLVVDPLNLLFGAGVLTKTTKAGRKILSVVDERKAKKIIQKIKTRADELVDTKNMNPSSATQKAFLEQDVHHSLLAESLGVTSSKLRTRDASGKYNTIPGYKEATKSKYIPYKDKTALQRKTDKFFQGAIVAKDFIAKPFGYIDDAIKPVLTRIKTISIVAGKALEKFEYAINLGVRSDIKKVSPWLKEFKKLKPVIKTQLTKALNNSDMEKVEALMRNNREGMFEEYTSNVKPFLDARYAEIKSTNKDLEYLPDYFPRVVKFNNRQKVINSFDEEAKNGINALIKQKEKSTGGTLSAEEWDDAINEWFKGNKVKIDKLDPKKPISSEKQRVIDELDDISIENYELGDAALIRYIRDTNHAIHRRKFFAGFNSKITGADSVEDSIANITRQEVNAGNMSIDDLDELKDLLRARFIGGEKPINKHISNFKAFGYAVTIGNPFSAITQLGDLGTSAYTQGIVNTTLAVAKNLTRSNKLKMDDYAVDLMAELGNLNSSSKFLNNVFKYSGFKSADKLGKSTIVNASLLKWSSMGNPGAFGSKIRSSKRLESDLRTKFKGTFDENRINKLIDDFKDYGKSKGKGAVTDDMMFVTFTDLLDVQPIVMSSMPKLYLNNPNLRILWQLKTFMLKQVDLVRETSVKKIKQGNVVEGMADLARYGVLVSSANTGSDVLKKSVDGWISGEDTLENYLDQYPNLAVLAASNLFKVFGVSNYTAKQLSNGQLKDVAVDQVTPPSVAIGADALEATADLITEQDTDNLVKMIRNIPIVGKMLEGYLTRIGAIDRT